MCWPFLFHHRQGGSSRAAQLKPDPRMGAGGGEGGPDYIGWGDDFSSIATTRASPTASRSSPSSALLLLNGHILQSKTGRGRGSGRFKTLGQTRHAYLADRAAANRGNRWNLSVCKCYCKYLMLHLTATLIEHNHFHVIGLLYINSIINYIKFLISVSFHLVSLGFSKMVWLLVACKCYGVACGYL